MSWLRLLHRRRADASLQVEMECFLAEEAAENKARGMTEEEAQRRARLKLGNPLVVRETLWRQNSIPLVEDLLRDLRYAFRTLLRVPAFTSIATLIIALGIGANLTIFTVVHSVLLKPLPFKNPERLMMIREESGHLDTPVAGGVYTGWKQQNRSFLNLALVGEAEYNLSTTNGDLPERVHGAYCSWNLLSTFGVKPALGRDFTSSDDQRATERTAILSWGLWKRRFGGDASILNHAIHVNSHSYRVIGVLPEWFTYPEDPAVQMLSPVTLGKPEESLSSLNNHQFQVIGRLRPEVTALQATADLSLISHYLHDAHLDDPFIGKAATLSPLLDDIVDDIKHPLYLLFGATGCVLLIACLNVANLFVARAAVQGRELAIRKAVGGTKLRLMRQRLAEVFLISFAGGAGGLALTYGAISWLVKTRPELSRVEAIHIDGITAAAAVGLVLLCTLVAGIISSSSSSDNRLLSLLQDAARGSSTGQDRVKLRRILLTLEVGLTVVLLTTAGLLLKSYEKLRTVDMGCFTQNVLTMRIGLFGAAYNKPEDRVRFYEKFLSRVRALPGVQAAGFIKAVPGQGYWEDSSFSIPEHPPLQQGKGLYALYRPAEAGYFQAMGIPLLRGRIFSTAILHPAKEAVISKLFADRHFPAEDPLGKHLRIKDQDYEIVGIVGDVRHSISSPPEPTQYVSLYADTINNGTLVLRSSQNIENFAMPVQRILQEFDRGLPVSDVLPMPQLLGKSMANTSFNTTLLSGFALLSLSLATAGLFGVLSYIATQRTSEIGIRIALGARRGTVLRLLLLDGLRPALFGLILGLAASVACTRLVQSMLYATHSLDPAVFALVSLLLIVVAALACITPAWKVSRINPVHALRAE